LSILLAMFWLWWMTKIHAMALEGSDLVYYVMDKAGG
jgi:hypothetical protein